MLQAIAKTFGILALFTFPFGPLLLLAALIYPFFMAYKALHKFKENRELCPHTIRGGLKLQRCPQCVSELKKQELLQEEQAKAAAEKKKLEEEQRRREQERQRREQERRTELIRQASVLANEERKRISSNLLRLHETLLSLPSESFEDVVAELFRKNGYDVTQTPYVNDGGKDALAYKYGEKSLIECKRWGIDKKVGRPDLQKFFAAMVEETASKGFFVTTSSFSQPAIEYATAHNIELIDSSKLVAMMQEAYPQNGSSLSVRQVCIECGEIVTFSISTDKDEEKVTCPNLHTVKRSITFSDLFLKKSASPVRKWKRNRSYKR